MEKINSYLDKVLNEKKTKNKNATLEAAAKIVVQDVDPDIWDLQWSDTFKIAYSIGPEVVEQHFVANARNLHIQRYNAYLLHTLKNQILQVWQLLRASVAAYLDATVRRVATPYLAALCFAFNLPNRGQTNDGCNNNSSSTSYRMLGHVAAPAVAADRGRNLIQLLDCSLIYLMAGDGVILQSHHAPWQQLADTAARESSSSSTAAATSSQLSRRS
ncbi:hypothetical protein ACLKA7_005282 [Drosophila subpalustris]